MEIENKEIISLGKNNKLNRFLKRAFDIVVSFVGVVVTLPIIFFFVLLVRIKYKESGFFTQSRIGMNGKKFKIIKIKSMKKIKGFDTTVTVNGDPRITPLGKFMRKHKIDELPQLINVLKGDMSFVGPRPDVEELINSLDIKEKEIYLSIRPGITGPGTLKYRNEEEILGKEKKPEVYNKEVIFPEKVNLNKNYILRYSLSKDVGFIIKTICE